MLRVVILLLVLFAVPYLIYYAYTVWARRRALETGETPPSFGEGPMGTLAIVGLGLCIAFFVALQVFGDSLMGDSDPDAIYVPPRYEDGRIIPGHTIPPTRPGESQ